MAFIQKQRFSVSRPHQRGWMGGNQESICRSPRKPPAKPRCLTERQFAKRVEQLLGFFGDTFSWMFHGQGVHFSPRLCPTAPKLSHFFLSPDLQTLSNSSKPLIWLVRLGLPAECSAALPQQRLGGCSGLWAQRGGAWLASGVERKIMGSKTRVT